jgi:hypothetical protein
MSAAGEAQQARNATRASLVSKNIIIIEVIENMADRMPYMIDHCEARQVKSSI